MSKNKGLKYYKNQKEKKQFFKLIVIDTETEFDNLFKEILPEKFKKGGIWRGVQQSRYKLYNTFQRENLESKSPIDNVIEFIKTLDKQFQSWDKRNVVQSFFKNLGIEQLSLFAKLSILRHYEIPSPFLDWSRNPNIALYFAITDNNTNVTENDLDNYFSLYFLDKEHPYYKFNSKEETKLFEKNSLKNIIKRYHLYNKIFPSKKDLNASFNNDEFLYEKMKDYPIQRISDEEGDLVNHYTMSNLNITAQSGLFILNTDPFVPLEEAIFKRIEKLASDNDLDLDVATKRNIDNFVCFDIHKKFISKIEEALVLKSVAINEESIYPDFNMIKKDLTFDSVAKSMQIRN